MDIKKEIRKYRARRIAFSIGMAVLLVGLLFVYHGTCYYTVNATVYETRLEGTTEITTIETQDGNLWDWENRENEHYNRGDNVRVKFLDKGDGSKATQVIVNIERRN